MISEIVGHRRAIARYLVLAALVLAPFVIWIPAHNAIALRTAYVALAGALCVLALASRTAFVIACLLLVPSALVHQHVSRHWGDGQLDARYEAFFESPPGEIREYLQSHVDALDIAMIAGSFAYLGLLLYWTVTNGNTPRPVSRLAAVLVITGLATIGSLRLDRRLGHFPPYEVLAQPANAKQRYTQLSLRNDHLRKHPLSRKDCRLRYDKVVIVFGESASSEHMSVFGYPKPTTPFALRSGAHAFDALSPSNQTRYSLGMMLTGASPGSFDSFYSSHSLVGELRSCGLRTLWISNQGRRGQYDSFSTSIAREADEQVFLNDWSWKSSQLDGVIVHDLAERGAYRKSGQATFIHLIGSHTQYKQRVPAGFGAQPAADIVSQYDNTILYTDRILSDLYERFSGGSLLFIYVSDHGQLVSDAKFGSGSLPGYQEEYRTPLLIWTDDEAAIAALRDSIGESQLNLESFDDVVRYLTGLTPTLRVSTRATVSVLTPEYVVEFPALESLPER
ncbi:MAG TPA: phosphoethanolamine transferase [Steroidobacteraceae bacterium]|nr:phosphoethanolamine transferase [Steroidobacteraceae bacterium]